MGGYKGYILTRAHLDIHGRHLLRYTGAGDCGPFEIIITRDRPLFFIHRKAVLPGRIFLTSAGLWI